MVPSVPVMMTVLGLCSTARDSLRSCSSLWRASVMSSPIQVTPITCPCGSNNSVSFQEIKRCSPVRVWIALSRRFGTVSSDTMPWNSVLLCSRCACGTKVSNQSCPITACRWRPASCSRALLQKAMLPWASRPTASRSTPSSTLRKRRSKSSCAVVCRWRTLARASSSEAIASKANIVRYSGKWRPKKLLGVACSRGGVRWATTFQ